MNSVLLKENMPEFFNRIGKVASAQIVSLAIAYQGAIRKSNAENLGRYSAALLNAVQKNERQSGVRILQTADGNCSDALLMLSSVIQNEANAVYRELQPISFRKTFSSVEDANAWLSEQDSITVTHMDIDTRYRFGLLAGHSEATGILLDCTDYRRPIGYRYGMLEQELTRIFGGNPESFKQKWQDRYPGTELCLMSSIKNSRFGINTLYYVKHMHYFCVYRKKTGSAALSADGNRIVADVVSRLTGAPKKLLCPHCGKPIVKEAVFCTSCGAPLEFVRSFLMQQTN